MRQTGSCQIIIRALLALALAVCLPAFLVLAAEAPPLPLTVAVLDLEGSQGHTVSEMLATAMAARKSFKLVERKRLKAVLDEMEFGAQAVSGGVAQQIGTLTGADAVLTGSVAHIGGALRIDARLALVRDGSVVAAAGTGAGPGERSLARAVESVAADLEAALKKTGPAPFAFTLLAMAPGGAPRAVAQGGTMRSGEHYKITFTPDRDCHVYIFQMDSAGRLFQLFPMDSFGGTPVKQFNPVRKGVPYVLPGPDKAFVLDRQTGPERIYCAVSDGQSPKLEALYAEVEKARRDNAPARERQGQARLKGELATRGLAAVTPDAKAQTAWEPGGEPFALMTGRLSQACRDCVHVLEFKHR